MYVELTLVIYFLYTFNTHWSGMMLGCDGLLIWFHIAWYLFAYDTVRQDISYIFNYIDSAIAFAKRHHQCILCTWTVIAENPGEDDNLSILKAWSWSVAHVNTSSVSHCLNENNLVLADNKLHTFISTLVLLKG